MARSNQLKFSHKYILRLFLFPVNEILILSPDSPPSPPSSLSLIHILPDNHGIFFPFDFILYDLDGVRKKGIGDSLNQHSNTFSIRALQISGAVIGNVPMPPDCIHNHLFGLRIDIRMVINRDVYKRQPPSHPRAPVSILMVVLFPAPFGPNIHRISPLYTSKLTPSTACLLYTSRCV